MKTIDERLESAAHEVQRAVTEIPARPAEGAVQGHRVARVERAVAVMALAVAAIGGTALLMDGDGGGDVAASPMTGESLVVMMDNPVVLQGEIAVAPRTAPDGVEIVLAPLTELTENDLAAIEEVFDHENYTDPIVVALGEVTEFDLHLFAVHQLDPETRSGRSSLVAVGPDYPSFTSYSKTTQLGTWGPSGGWTPADGLGEEMMRLSDEASYAVVEIGDRVFWQRPSDGFVWIPYYSAEAPSRLVTAAYTETGEELFRNVTDGYAELEQILP